MVAETPKEAPKPKQERVKSVRRNEKSQRRAEAAEEPGLLGGAETFATEGDMTIHGLGGQMALKAVGKRGKKNLLAEKAQQEEEERKTKERMKQLA